MNLRIMMRRLNKRNSWLLLLPFLLAACQSYKKVPYFQNVEVVNEVEQQEKLYDAKIMPKDLLTIVVSCTNPELAIPFNLTVASNAGIAVSTSSYVTTQPVLQPYLGKYDFIKLGNLLYWHDPDSGLSNGVYQVASIPENIEEDSVILIASDTSEAEVFPSELSPIHTGRSHKEDFLRWKTEREAEGIEFYDHLSKVMDTENDLSVGDMVAFTNDYGVIFGPCEVLAFGNLCNSGRCVYIDSDSYWFPNRPDQLTIMRGAE